MTDVIAKTGWLLPKELRPDFHDAELLAIELRTNNVLVLTFKLVEEKCSEVVLNDVTVFRVSDFIKQNVVSRLLVSPEFLFTDEQLTYCVNWINSLCDTKTLIKSEAIQQHVACLRNAEWCLFVLEPSWGAEVAVICKTVKCGLK